MLEGAADGRMTTAKVKSNKEECSSACTGLDHWHLNQGILTEGEGSEQLTSL